MKKIFFTGLIILLPIAITCMIISFLINFFTEPFQLLTRKFLSNFSFFSRHVSEQFIPFIANLLIIFIGIIVIATIGFTARFFTFRSVLHLGDQVLRRIPFVRNVYNACKDFTEVLFGTKSNTFTQVALVPFPSEGRTGMGLVTNEFISNIEGTERSYVSVLIPGTPNPITGFLIVLPKEKVHYLSLSVQDAMRYIMSCGAYFPDHFVDKKIKL